MKPYALLVIASILGMNISLQAEESKLLDDSDYWNFYFQPELTFSHIGRDNASYLGLDFGASLNERFDIGLAGYGLINDVDLNLSGLSDAKAGDIYYGGLVLRFHFTPCCLIDVSVQTFVGAGRIDIGETMDGNKAKTDVLIVEPSLNVGVNLTDHIVLGARIGHWTVDGSDEPLIENGEFEKLSGAVYIRFDEF